LIFFIYLSSDGFQPYPAYAADSTATAPYPTTYPNPPYPNAYQNSYPSSNPQVYPANAYATAQTFPAPYPGPKYPTAYDGSPYSAGSMPVGNRRDDSEVLISDVSVTVVPTSDNVEHGGGGENLANEWSSTSFSDKAIRRAFIQKVGLTG